MLYFAIWLVVLIISVVLFKQASGTLSIFKPNVITITFYYSLLVSSFVGSLFIALDVDNYYMTKKLFHPEYRGIGFAVICFVMICIPLVIMLLHKLLGIDAKNEFQRYLDRPLQAVTVYQFETWLIFAGLTLFSVLGIAYMILKSSQIPIIELLLGHKEVQTAALRIDASRGFRGNVLIRNIFALMLPPMLALMTYCFSVLTRQLKWYFLFLINFCGAVFISIYDLAKSPIFFFFIMFVIVQIYIGKLRLSGSRVVWYVVTGASVLVLMYVVIQGVTDLKTFLSFNKGPFGRIFLAQISPMYLHLNIFGEGMPFLYGRSLPSSLTSLFDVNNARSAREVMAYVFPDRLNDGTGGVLNTLYVAEAYANFGYIGIIVGTIYVATFLQIIYVLFMKLQKNPITVSLFVYFTINLPRTLVGGFTDFIFNPIWMMIIIIFGGLMMALKLYERIVIGSVWRKRFPL